MNRQAWRDFFITVFFLGLAFIIALLSSVAAEQQSTHLATVAAAISLLLALIGALYIIPRLARNVRFEALRFAIRTTFTLEGLLFVVFLIIIAFAAWNNGNNLLYLVLSAMLAFLIAANLIARVSLADVSIQLRFPDHIFAGEPASINVTLVNHKRFMPSYSLMVEALSEEEQGRGGAAGQGDSPLPLRPSATLRSPTPLGKLAYFVLVPARRAARQRVEHTFERRGRYPITGFRVATKFPAGFFKKWRRIDASGEILVYPKPQPLDDFYHTLPMLAGQIQSHARGLGDDLYAIRRYHPSDHMRYIDWKATAKSLEMMVREHMREDEWRLTIVFDATEDPSEFRAREAAQDRARAAPEEFQERFERAVLMAASLANHFILERAEVELITNCGQYNVASSSGHEHLYKLLGALAIIQPVPLESDLDKEKKQGHRFLRRKSSLKKESQPQVGAVSRQSNSSIAWRLLDQIPVLADERRFKVLITSARKGTIPAHVWRSAHVVFMDDL